ncbi:hypothetical protein CJU94_36115 (plasmid) [Paraburkholderia aromaticivorans]|uniref:Uncharacterized protein n=1 Tax=Paraburkholderia aromaticivorans TaxID=2026199 RepID=A0A248VYM8_9BURK|nr:hypothetical protein CJU94_36115 [Paraburkholderia aromaticivorans]
MSPTVMHARSIAQGVEAPALAVAGAWCFRAGKWKLAFVPLVCAGMIGLVTGYWLLGEGNVG